MYLEKEYLKKKRLTEVVQNPSSFKGIAQLLCFALSTGFAGKDAILQTLFYQMICTVEEEEESYLQLQADSLHRQP